MKDQKQARESKDYPYDFICTRCGYGFCPWDPSCEHPTKPPQTSEEVESRIEEKSLEVVSPANRGVFKYGAHFGLSLRDAEIERLKKDLKEVQDWNNDREHKVLRLEEALNEAKRMFSIMLVEPREEPKTAHEFKSFWERDKRDATNALTRIQSILEGNK